MNDNITVCGSTVGNQIIISSAHDVDAIVVNQDDIDELIEKLQEYQ